MQIAIQKAADLCAGITDDQFKWAVEQHLKSENGHWWPTVGDLLKLIPAKAETSAEEHYEILTQKVNYYNPPEIKGKKGKWKLSEEPEECEALEHALYCLGGWEKFCLIEDDEDAFRKKEFVEYYNAFRTQQKQQKTFRPAIGMSQRQQLEDKKS